MCCAAASHNAGARGIEHSLAEQSGNGVGVRESSKRAMKGTGAGCVEVTKREGNACRYQK